MKTLEQYLALPYTMIVRWSPQDELFVARVKEIDGCTGHGDDESSALAMLRDNLREWLAFCLETGDEIPEPADTDALPSGKWLQRVPRSLHAALAAAAEQEGVSLNQFVVSILSKEIGARTGHPGAISNVSGSSPAVSDPWARLTHFDTSRWQINLSPASESLEFVYMNALVATLPKENQSISLEKKDHGKTKEAVWH